MKKKINQFIKYVEASTDIKFSSITPFYHIRNGAGDRVSILRIYIDTNNALTICIIKDKIVAIDITFYSKATFPLEVSRLKHQLDNALFGSSFSIQTISVLKKNLTIVKKVSKSLL